MRSLSTRTITSLLLAAMFSASALAPSRAQSKSINILEYYLMMPQRYLKYAGGESAKERNAAIFVSDVENGYLQARRSPGEFYSSLALFKLPDGGDLIAVENRECSRGCSEEFYLLAYRNGEWADVTGSTLPALSEQQINTGLDTQLKPGQRMAPRVMHKLSVGGAPIYVSEYWSGLGLGFLEWINGQFVFKPLVRSSASASRPVLASTTNVQGDRLEIIAIDPDPSTRLPLKGRLNVKVGYELRSAPTCHVWTLPIVLEQRLPDHFTNGSMSYQQGAGELMTWFGFDNQAHLQQFEVVMSDDRNKTLLRLKYNVDMSWEGTLECPTFHAECFPDASSPSAPLACMIYPSGVRPDQELEYNWTISAGRIVSGQGTRRIILNTDGFKAQDVRATVDVGGLPAKCANRFSSKEPLGMSPK
ncbi:MAG: hypothetical protein QOJ64_2128 [Acidobacteriota bacterium]|nr:hypothetical protein [Acidobacteriota bacterium]